jgi:RNA polymerase sigma-70 factor (ECF subfamily)
MTTEQQDPADRLYESVLVLRCQTGDERAFVEIVGRYHCRLRSFLRQMLRDEHAAEDVLQDVWLDVFRKIHTLRDAGAFVGWLFQVARGRAYGVLRKRGGIRTVPLEPEQEHDFAAEPEPKGEPDEAAVVNASFEVLPHEQREVILLRFMEGMSYEQIATAVGCEVGTVRSRLHYGKRALRRELERKHAND